MPLPPPRKGTTSERTRRSAAREYAVGQGKRRARPASPKQRAAATRALKREPRSTVSKSALSKQARQASRRKRRASAS